MFAMLSRKLPQKNPKHFIFNCLVAQRQGFASKVKKIKKVTMGDPIEHATGIEKRELLAKVAGNDDPWGLGLCKVGIGTKDDPIQVPSAFDARIVGCICTEESNSINYMWVYEDEPKRCECGRWFCLVHVEAFG